MDYHKDLSITVEDVKKAHEQDIKIQQNYGVTYHQFWVNQEAGTIFCLIEGPNKEACEAVHREAHGNIASAIVEVEPGLYKLLMGEALQVDEGLVKHDDGTIDLGYRNIMAVTLSGTAVNPKDDQKAIQIAKKLVLDKLVMFKGRKLNLPFSDNLIGIFTSPSQSVRCALEIQHALTDLSDIIFKIALCAGQPVTEKDEFFGETIQFANRLCAVADVNHILLSSLVNDLCDINEIGHQTDKGLPIKILNTHDEIFLTVLLANIDSGLSNDGFTVDQLTKNMAMSRPRLYRKIVSLTGRPPNDLIRDLRMDKAISLLKRKSGNISEIALEVGFNNPSYFARCFAKKFGCSPSKFLNVS